MNHKIVDIPNIKELREGLTGIGDLYSSLGWDGKQNLDPKKVIINEKDWLTLLAHIMGETDIDTELRRGFNLMNIGPSGNKNIPKGKVKLIKGWLN